MKNQFLLKSDSLVFQLFGYMSTVLILILVLQAIAEHALIRVMLGVPLEIKNELYQLVEEANSFIDTNDISGLEEWEESQPYYIFVLNNLNKPLTSRQMHPHFEFKLKFLREIDEILDNKVNKPLIGMGLRNGNKLIVQLPSQKHPAHRYLLFFSISKVIIAVLTLLIVSYILAKNLQNPLNRLREASRRLACGDFSVNVVSELKSKTREFNDLASDFDHMADQISQLSGRQRQLIRDVSHELRTPLARQNIAIHLLRAQVDEKGEQIVDRLEAQVDEMNKMVGEILEFSRLENARYEANFKWVDLGGVISMQIEQARRQLVGAQVIDFNLERSPCFVVTDERLFVRCIDNLLSNAMKYAGTNASISVRTLDITRQGKAFTRVQVSDNGPGVPQEKIEEIFTPFTRLDSSRAKARSGYGLGLSIAKESVLLLGGTIIAENLITGGLSIEIDLPQSEISVL